MTTDLIHLLGKHKNSPELLQFLAPYGGHLRWDQDDEAIFRSVHDQGFELLFTLEGALQAILLLAEGEDNARQFQGEDSKQSRFRIVQRRHSQPAEEEYPLRRWTGSFETADPDLG